MIKDVLNLFFPEVCSSCSSLLLDNENTICLNCRHDLPVTDFHFDNKDDVIKRLYGRVPLQEGTALFHYEKGSKVQNLLHNLKYRGQIKIGNVLGKWLGEELSNIERYRAIDVVIPVPLHKLKLKKRGYNQVEQFAKEIALKIDAVYNDDVLFKTKHTKTQVFKNRLSRTETTSNFEIKYSEDLEFKHVLLVDDIITTGATIEACANELLKIKGLKISVASMAITV